MREGRRERVRKRGRKRRGGERNKATKAELEDSWLYIERMCLLSQR